MKREIEVYPNNPTLSGIAGMQPAIRYSEADEDCLLYLLAPWNAKGGRHPLILFIQGSGWTHPKVWNEIPQLSAYARRGYVVATVSHRSAVKGNAFPAYLQDCKTALRFLRAHAEEYGIDPERVCVWGTSSGGNTALLMAVTPDEEKYKTAEYADFSDRAQVVIDCFGPSDIPGFIDFTNPMVLKNELFHGLVGDADPMKVANDMSPLRFVRKGGDYPKMLLIHGDNDPVVPYEQSVRMAEALDEADADVTLIRVAGAEHEGSFWSDALHQRIGRFIEETL